MSKSSSLGEINHFPNFLHSCKLQLVTLFSNFPLLGRTAPPRYAAGSMTQAWRNEQGWTAEECLQLYNESLEECLQLYICLQ